MEEKQEEKVVKTEKNKSKFSVIAFVLGLVSIVCFYFSVVSVPCAILAVIFAALDRKVNTSTMSVAGLVMGIITLALYVVVLFTCLILDMNFSGITSLIETIL